MVITTILVFCTRRSWLSQFRRCVITNPHSQHATACPKHHYKHLHRSRVAPPQRRITLSSDRDEERTCSRARVPCECTPAVKTSSKPPVAGLDRPEGVNAPRRALGASTERRKWNDHPTTGTRSDR